MAGPESPSGGSPPPRSSGDPDELATPGAERLLEGVLALGRELHLEMKESEIVQRFVDVLAELFPQRVLAVRVLDPRTSDPAHCWAVGAALRPGIEDERVVFRESAVAKTHLKTAVTASARLRLAARWDSPFVGIAAGFAVPLVASGELYGVLDVGYRLGADNCAADEPLILPIANTLSVALRNERLHRDTISLRDYQARLIEHANALILGVDHRLRITVCNRALCQLIGAPRDELVGRDLRDLLREDQLARLTRLFRQAFSGQLTDTVDITIESSRGPVRTVWSVAAISGRGRVEAVVAVGQDQTKLRDLQAQVIQAEKLATLGQLAAGVVHELNNPLTSITVYAEYLVRKGQRACERGEATVPDAADLEKLERIAAGAQRIQRFARDLVQYAKPAGAELDVVDVNDAVAQSVSFCEHVFERSGIAHALDLAPMLPTVYAVPGQIEQVLINLITNAAHAIEGGGKVTIETRVPEPGWVAITVSDTGPGIAPEDRTRIFEPFYTTKTDGKGSGLGLSIVANIVDQHEGKIEVGDVAEGGARITVFFPAAR
jgi:two-component system NtrC family sensor kinase